DEPAYTQPTLYKQIAQHKPVSDFLTHRLINEGLLTLEEAEAIKKEFEDHLEESFKKIKKEVELTKEKGKQPSTRPMLEPQPPYSFKPVKTAVDIKELTKIAKVLTHIPSTFNANPKILRQLTTKWEAFTSGKDIDWGMGEALAFGTLLVEGIPIRISGQDSERGTFSHRHSVLYDMDTLERYVPLRHLEKDQSVFCVHNSSLSEAAVLGFDFGYSLDYPQMLCIWEAQFGDFANGAQSIFDQFIASSESKWQRVSSLVMFLPHGYEGQGPEHSSARLERYLQACAEENIQVCNVTTPAQLFHLLRRQKKQAVIKPLVLMTPKSLLRHKLCVSRVEDFTKGHFECILDEPQAIKKAERVIFCSGKLYYDLVTFREENKIKNTAIIRLEQLYPLDKETLSNLISKYKNAKSFLWCQEEPKNMGAWSFIAPELQKLLGEKPLNYVGRKAAASPATGALAIHKIEQTALLEESFSK
ncbi:MAG: 2-oxoglutarate dehydrogenase E1 component, partial [Verrucomicrobia bacterium]